MRATFLLSVRLQTTTQSPWARSHPGHELEAGEAFENELETNGEGEY